MKSYYRIRDVSTGGVFLSVCVNPEDWYKSCSPCKLGVVLHIRKATFERDWWRSRGLKTDDLFSAMFIQEGDN
jgi:hypothetical protein